MKSMTDQNDILKSPMQERVLFLILVLISALLLKRLGVFTERDADPFVNYVIYFSLPALVFREIRGVPLSGETVGVVLIAWGVILGSLAVSWFLGRIIGMEEKTLRSFVLVSSFGNTAFLGYPFTYALFGEEGLRFAVLYDQIGSFLLVVSAGFALSTGRVSPREIITFPPFLALLAGLLLKDIKLPSLIDTFLDVVGDSLIPTVLFAIGLRFSVGHVRDSLGYTLLSLTLKMLVAPLLVLAGIKAFSLDSLGYRVALLETSMPPMVMAGILAMKYGLDERLALSSITLGILVSFLTVPLWVSLI